MTWLLAFDLAVAVLVGHWARSERVPLWVVIPAVIGGCAFRHWAFHG